MKSALAIMKHIQTEMMICFAETRAVSIKRAMPLNYSQSRHSFELDDLLDLTGYCVLQERPLPGVNGAD